ncbi:MAG: hypothetical protein EOM12_07495 [Verrucomicrobiae bacterium]|nr:hypothetical protein [Verrucomicrobiae bacterium]
MSGRKQFKVDFYVGYISTTVVTTAVIVHALPSGLAAADSGTAKPGTGAFVASPTNEAHGTGPVVRNRSQGPVTLSYQSKPSQGFGRETGFSWHQP